MSQLEPEQPLFDDDESQLEPLQSVLLDLSAEVVFEPQSLPLHEFEELVLYDDEDFARRRTLPPPYHSDSHSDV